MLGFARSPVLNPVIPDGAAVYNIEGLLAWKRALYNRASSPAIIACVGDSITERYNPKAVGQGWCDLIKARLTTAYPTSGVTNVATINNLPSYFVGGTAGGYVPYTTLHGAQVEQTSGQGMGSRQGSLNATGDGVTWTVTCSKAFVDLISSGGAPNAKAAISVDGSPIGASPVDTGGGFPYYHVWQDTGISVDGSHTIKVTRDATSTQNVGLGGIFFYRDEYTKGIQVYELGHAGAGLITYGPGGGDISGLANAPGTPSIIPHLYIMSFGMNDTKQGGGWGVDKATWKAGAQTAIANARKISGANCSFLFVFLPFRGDGTVGATGVDNALNNYREYEQAAREIAMADVGGPSGSSAICVASMQPQIMRLNNTGVGSVDTYGYGDTDKIHPTTTGHTMIADLVTRVISL